MRNADGVQGGGSWGCRTSACVRFAISVTRATAEASPWARASAGSTSTSSRTASPEGSGSSSILLREIRVQRVRAQHLVLKKRSDTRGAVGWKGLKVGRVVCGMKLAVLRPSLAAAHGGQRKNRDSATFGPPGGVSKCPFTKPP